MLMGIVHIFPGETGNIKENKITISKKEAIETEFELSRSLLKYSNIDIESILQNNDLMTGK